MNPILKEHLISAAQTFISTFLVVVGATLSQGGILWTSAFWSGVVISAASAAVKEVWARNVSVNLGGRK